MRYNSLDFVESLFGANANNSFLDIQTLANLAWSSNLNSHQSPIPNFSCIISNAKIEGFEFYPTLFADNAGTTSHAQDSVFLMNERFPWNEARGIQHLHTDNFGACAHTTRIRPDQTSKPYVQVTVGGTAPLVCEILSGAITAYILKTDGIGGMVTSSHNTGQVNQFIKFSFPKLSQRFCLFQ